MPMGCFYRHPYIHICICHRCIHVVDDDVLYVWDRDNYINSSAWVSRCSFNNIGQCESLKTWNGWQARFPRFFVSVHLGVLYIKQKQKNSYRCCIFIITGRKRLHVCGCHLQVSATERQSMMPGYHYMVCVTSGFCRPLCPCCFFSVQVLYGRLPSTRPNTW